MVNLFLYDAFCYSYHVAYKIGDVRRGKSAFLSDHSLIFIQNSNKGFPKASIVAAPKKRVYGVLYQISDEQFKMLKSKILVPFSLELKTVGISRALAVFTLVPISAGSAEAIPFRWYLDLMLAGLNQVRTPKSYLKSIDNQKSQKEYHIYESNAKNLLNNYPLQIQKNLITAFKLLQDISKGGTFKIKSKPHPLNGREITIAKDKGGFTFETTTLIKKGIQNSNEFILRAPDLKISNDYFVTKKSYVANKVQYGDTFKMVSGTIQSMRSVSLAEKSYYWRLLIPISQTIDIRHSFEWWSFLSNGQPHAQLLKLFHNSTEIHFYGYKNGNQHYAAVDALEGLSLKRFQEIVYAILLIYGLLKGKFYSGEGFFVAYSDHELRDAKGVVYQQMSSSIYNLPGIHTSNPYTGIDQASFRRNNKGGIPKIFMNGRSKGIDLFPAAVFENLLNLLLEKDKIRDALTQIVLNQQATLEIRIPILYVALETISGVISTGGDKDLKPIKDKKRAEKLTQLLKATTEQFAKDEGFSKTQIEELTPLIKRLSGLNNPPNSDKLSKVFQLVGYDLREWDKLAINERNAFLHGFTPKLKVSADEYGFKEFYDLSLRLHFLLCVLLLKKAGFEGKILNYNKLHEHITHIIRGEDTFVMI